MSFWKEENAKEAADFYSNEATLYDDDGGLVVVGKEDIEDYLSTTFQLAQERGHPELKLIEYDYEIDGEHAVVRGTYHWPKMHSGRYTLKWRYEQKDWKIVEHYFTIEAEPISSLE
uniref:DUF4440 domain-containing protein n=1 Tax=Plectus sambesii TaxID=2011161 RepID=A0A914VYM9_9BILA